MIERIIAFCMQQRLMVVGMTLAIAVSGVIAFEELPVQAFPDMQNVFVQVVTQYPGQAPEEVERMRERRFIATALGEGKVIYESE